MARPTLIEQIQKAAEAGDLERVKTLTLKLSGKTPKKEEKPEVAYINNFVDDLTENTKDLEVDKKIIKSGYINQREKPEKVNVNCSACNTSYTLWPGDIFKSEWTCNSCLVRRKK